MTDMKTSQKIDIEVVLAMPEHQVLVSVELDQGATIADAIEQSAILEAFVGFELDPAKVGIFGRKAAMSDVLRNGDRVEIYRPLIADPKESRRQRALKQAKA
jgi:putative ubiquitin-RnfH superfamily antitoxin RatB of RatAB toxin-antitoxin module